MSTFHIGLYFSNFSGGGIQRVMLSLSEGFLRLGWQVDLILVQADGPLRAEIPQGARLIDLKAGKSTRSILKLAAYLASESPAVVLSSQTHLNVSAIIARFLSGWKGRLLVSEHIALDFSAQNPNSWKDRLHPLLASLFYHWADQIILVSFEAARRFMKITHLPANKIKVIYNPIVSQKLLEQSTIQPDHPWFKSPGLKVILAAGRLVKQKDFKTLLKSFSLLKTKLPMARLMILGDGKEHPQLMRLAKNLGLEDAVHFPGFVVNPFAYMAHSSVFVLSSQWEGFANVLVESMACGTPVISTNCPSGPSEILEDGKYGILTPVGDANALAEAILDTLAHPIPPEILRQRAMSFSVDNILNQYISDIFQVTAN
ncbi:MAG: glycosyltransferase [Chloroflexi bacterium]|nr:glycosyltransferase [Chloroflexota bacterium]